MNNDDKGELEQLVEKLIDLHADQLSITSVYRDRVDEFDAICADVKTVEAKIKEIFNPPMQLWQLP